MSQQQDFMDTYSAALRAERELWAEMKGRCPGRPGFDQKLWDKWLAAVSRCTATSKAMRQLSMDSRRRRPA
jgi:hypothetical protein